MKNSLIVLNGSSSSGKTLIAQALQNIVGKDRCKLTGFDDILERVQPFGAQDGSLKNKLMFNFRVFLFQFTDGRLKLFKQLHREVIDHVKTFEYVVVETTFMDRRVLVDAAVCFAPIGGFLIGIKPPLEVSEKWEAQRTDRRVGHARKHYELAHSHETYDLILDTSIHFPEDCALKILRRVNAGNPKAFSLINTYSKT